jgi:hypothetical protein
VFAHHRKGLRRRTRSGRWPLDRQLTGGFFTQLINFIERFGRVHSAALPSAHVSGSLVALLGAWHYRRWLFWIFLAQSGLGLTTR